MQKPELYFLKYTLPTSLRKARYPCSQFEIGFFGVPKVPVEEGVVESGFPPVINEAYWKKYLKNVAFPIWLKKDM